MARSPANPTHYWGNFLLFDQVPEAAELPEWRVRFAAEFAADPEARHLTFGVAAPAADLAGLTHSPDPDLALTSAPVLVSRQASLPPARDPGVELRALQPSSVRIVLIVARPTANPASDAAPAPALWLVSDGRSIWGST